jgi:16S rRNA G966 N2-methylase RsmD
MPNIYDVQNFKGKSIRNSWTSENLKKALRFNRKYHSTPYLSEIIRSLGFVSGLANVTIYKPITTHSLITKLSSKTVLDFCVGWGGRMIGTACRADRHYIGIEPNVETYGNLCRLRDFLQLKNVELINDCAENVVDSIDGYDTTLTSPPYYNLEIYCDEKTQSINLGTYSEWLDKFIFKLINSSFDKATYYCWSVKNFKTDKQYNLMDDITNHYASRGGNVVCKYDIKNKQRPGVKRKEKNTSEQTLVFSKNTHIINPPHMFFVDI